MVYNADMELTEYEKLLLDKIRKLQWGYVEAQVQDNKLTLVTVKEHIKLTPKK